LKPKSTCKLAVVRSSKRLAAFVATAHASVACAVLGLCGCTDATSAVEKGAHDAAQVDAAQLDAPAIATSTPDAANSCGCESRCTGNRCLTTLAEGPQPTRLVLDDANVYFTTCNSSARVAQVFRVPLAGGAPVAIAGGSTCAADLARYDDALYVAGLQGNDVWRVPAGGGAAALVASAMGPLAGIAADATSLYATTAAGVLKSPLDGGVFTTLATIPGQRDATRPVLDEQNVYFADPVLGAVYRVSKDGGDVTTLASGLGGVEALALAGTALYVAAGYVVVKIPASGGPPVTLGTAAGAEVLALTVDDSGVYFTSSGVVWTLPLAGGTPVALVTDDGDLDAIATNDAALFWTASPACDASDCKGRVQRLSPK
jgi:hypothetical protein